MSNIPPSIQTKIGVNLHQKTNHPICIIKNKIYQFFGEKFAQFDNLSPIVSIIANFDDLLIPKNHPCRSKTDTFYVDEKTVLRTQTSAHQTELLRKGYDRFLVTGDVYRKDEVNKTHYPVFHQMEGVCVGEGETELKETMKKLIEFLFPQCEYRLKSDYFPFTNPSFEVEVKYNGEWLEVLGCGVIRSEILHSCGVHNQQGWAFGLGLERLAMILFGIPDIRLFWSEDARFIDQFQADKITKFVPFGVLCSVTKDLSFFVNDLKECDDVWDQINDFYEICREVSGDNLEKIEKFDTFKHPKFNLVSNTYRLTYNPPCGLNNPAEFISLVNKLHDDTWKQVQQKLNVKMR